MLQTSEKPAPSTDEPGFSDVYGRVENQTLLSDYFQWTFIPAVILEIACALLTPV